jgi:hypothetical protein
LVDRGRHKSKVGGARTSPYNPVLLGFGQGAVGNLLILDDDFSPVSGTADFFRNSAAFYQN